jgi:threonine/homoserine/homoserine lactone efflux protein
VLQGGASETALTSRPAANQTNGVHVPTQHTLLAFALVSLGITVTPGPSNLFILAVGIAHGRRRAVAAMGGIEIASAIRVLATAAGLSALLASSAIAFDTVRWAGVAYLALLGIRSFKSAPSRAAPHVATTAAPAKRSTRKGVIVGLGNPKMAIFFLAFFPQFIHPAQGSNVEQILILGAVFWVIGVVWDLGIAWGSGSIGNWLHNRPRVDAAKPRAEGATYLALAGWAAISRA